MDKLSYKFIRGLKIASLTVCLFGISRLYADTSAPSFQAVDTYLKLSSADRQQKIEQVLSQPLTERAILAITFLASSELREKYQDLWAKKAAYSSGIAIENPVFSASVLPQGQQSKVDISIEQDLIKWLILPLQSRASDSQFEANKLIFSEAILDRCSQVKKALIHYQASRLSLSIQSDFTEAEKATIELTQRQFDAGNINELQLKTQEVAYQDALLKQAEADLLVREAKLQFQQMMGLGPTQTAWIVTGNLSEVLPLVPSINELDRLIDKQRPDLASLEYRVEAEKKRLDAQEWQARLGSVKAGIQYEQEFDGSQSIGPKIELGLPLFNQGQQVGQEREATVRQLSALLESHRREAQYSARRLLAQLEFEAIELKRSKTVLIPLHQRVTELTQQHYNYMLLGVFTLIQAKQEELKAQQNHIQHLKLFWSTWAELEKEIGGDITQKERSHD